MLSALETHHRQRQILTLVSLRQKLLAWVDSNPREFAKRHGDSFFNLLQDQIDWEERLLRQKARATTLIQQLLQQRNQYIVNDADTTPANAPALQVSLQDQLKMAFQRTATAGDQNLMPSRGGNRRSPAYWQTLARQVQGNPTMGIRCGECAALVVEELRSDVQIQLPIAIIEQGKGAINGHFWVVVGYITNDKPTLRQNFGSDTFAIDLWGRSTFNVPLVNGPPARAPMTMGSVGTPGFAEANKMKVLVSWPANGTLGPPPT